MTTKRGGTLYKFLINLIILISKQIPMTNVQKFQIVSIIGYRDLVIV